MPSGSIWRNRIPPWSSCENPKDGLAKRACEAGKQELRGGFVVPDVRAVAEAAAALVVAAFEAVKFAVGRAEGGLRDERREIGDRCVAQRPGQRALTHRVHETARSLLEFRERCGGAPGRLPCVGESDAVVVPEVVVLVTLRRGPARPRGGTIGKMPREHERVARVGARRYLALQAQRPGLRSRVGLRPELAVFQEVVPEEIRTRPPFRSGPSAQIADASVIGLQHRDDERSVQRVGRASARRCS